MVRITKYKIDKENRKNRKATFEAGCLSGFVVQSKKKNVRLKDAVSIDKMIIQKPIFAENLIFRKINNKMKRLIDTLASIYDEDNDDPSGSLMLALNQIEKFKREIINKYNDYISKDKMRKLERKIRILEEQVTIHVYMINEEKSIEDGAYETKKSR